MFSKTQFSKITAVFSAIVSLGFAITGTAFAQNTTLSDGAGNVIVTHGGKTVLTDSAGKPRGVPAPPTRAKARLTPAARLPAALTAPLSRLATIRAMRP